MAEKFPFLDQSKQRAFSLDVARFAANGSRAAVVVAERERFTLFWSKDDGTWASLVRDHDALNLVPRRPERSRQSGWSRRIATTGAGHQVVLVYKRRFNESPAGDSWVDPFTFDAATERLQGGAPRRVPRQAWDIEHFGFTVWAEAADQRLQVVAQAFFAGALDRPRLVLLTARVPIVDSPALEDAASWTLTPLDEGGWDFDARRQGATLAVLHRRVAHAYATEVFALDPAFAGGSIAVPLHDDPALVPRTLTQMAVPSLTLVEVDLAATTVTRVTTGLPFGENPQLHRISPLVATVERLRQGDITVGLGRLRLRRFQSQCHLLMATRRGWRTTLLLAEPMRWPHYLQTFARVQQSIAVRPNVAGQGLRVELAWTSLWSLRPTVLFASQATDKGQLLTFGHQDAELGAVRASTFRVFEDDAGETLKALPDGFTLLDLGHRHIAVSDPDDEPVEHQQLRPHRIDTSAGHADATDAVPLDIQRVEDPGNTMGGMLAAAVDRPESCYAYTEMGDGGPRVVFESRLALPPPTAAPDDKMFQPAWVAEPPMPGRVWVRLQAPDFVAAELPGYFVAPTALSPQSLACDQQRALDGLAFAADRLRAPAPVTALDPLSFAVPDEGDGVVRYRDAPSVLSGQLVSSLSLSSDSANGLQTFVVEQSELVPPPPARSGSDQPFAIEIQQPTALRFASEVLTFDARVVDVPDQNVFQFAWTFSDGATFTGRHVEHQLPRTLPDFSRANPGGRRPVASATLTVTRPDGVISTVTTSFALPRSLWATLWSGYSAFRHAPDNVLDDNGDWQISEDEWASYLAPGMFVRDVTLAFFRYALRYQVDATGRGTRAHINTSTVHDSRFRFLGQARGQGDVRLEMPVRVAMTDVRLTGDFGGGLGALVAIRRVDAVLRCRQNYTIGVQTSERRDRWDGSETVQAKDVGFFTVSTVMLPSALCCLPVGDVTTSLADSELTVDSGLTGAGWVLGALVPAAIAAAGTVAVMAILLPIFLVVAPVIIGALTVAIIIWVLLGAGLGLAAALAIQEFVVKPKIRQTIKDALSEPEVAASLRDGGMFRYAGEGLAEALAIKLMRQARQDGHAVADPLEGGRDRFRAPFVETIVVSEGECKALLRV